MMRYKISTIDNKTVCEKAVSHETFIGNLKGLMFSRKMEDFDGLILKPCRSIHTCFMNYNIDVVFLDNKYRVVKILKDLPPWRMTRVYFTATQVLELVGNTVGDKFKEGDTLEVKCIN